ncbi:pyrroline-5-carboxylate reductase [bacterium]|nr:MAG: pyrroline-5-carboxylate reductase [bacterium]
MNDVTLLGAGKLGSALLRGWQRAGRLPGRAVTKSEASAGRVREHFSIPAGTSLHEALAGTRTIVVAVKPHQWLDVAGALEGWGDGGGTLVSVMAGVEREALARHLSPAVNVVRAMPNVLCSFNEGVTAVSSGAPEHVRALFAPLGSVLDVAETSIDVFTALTASAPALVLRLIEGFADAALALGLPADSALAVAAQVFRSTGAWLMESGEHPAVLGKRITTPGGCTIAGLLELERTRAAVGLADALLVTAQRARELGAPHSALQKL